MTLSEGCHQTGDFPVVLAVNVRARGVQELDNVKMTAVRGQPQTRVAFLITNIDLGTPEKQKENLKIVMEKQNYLIDVI